MLPQPQDLALHVLHAPLQPVSLSELHLGQRSAPETKPQVGQGD